MAAADAVVNFGVSTVVTAPTPALSGTTVVVTAGQGARFPVPPFNVTVMPATGQPTSLTAEIVRVTGIAADTLTIVRTQEASTARTILAGDTIAATITKKAMDDRLSFDAFDGLIIPPEIAGATAPATGLRLGVTRMTERSWLQTRRPQGMPTFISPHLGFNRVGVILAAGHGSAAVVSLGMGTLSVGGTPAGKSFATTNAYLRRKRLGYTSAATAAANSFWRVPNNCTIGSGGLGGFLVVTRFAIGDSAAVAGARTFVGVSTLAVAPTGAVQEPNTLTNHVGIGHGSADANMSLYFGGSTAQTPISLGANFPANTRDSDTYELILHAPAESSVIHYTVNRYGTVNNSVMFTVSGTLLNATPGTTLPSATTLLSSIYGWRTNNATALAISLDFFSHYFESDGA